MGQQRLANIRKLLNPRHIAFVGGRSMEPAIEICRASGYTGQIWPVHPHYETLADWPVYASVRDLPESPDATFLYVGRSIVAGVVRDLAEMRAGGAICHAAGFGELEAAGQTYADALLKAAGDLAVVGPNSNGLLNYLDRVVLWPIDDHRPPQIERGVAIITQSGGVAFNYVDGSRSVPAAYVISTGNQAITDVGDFIRVLAEDERVQAIGLFLEGIGDVQGFSEAATFALARNIPIVALKTGRTEIGARMALTHTGSMAGSDELYDALFARLGIARVRSIPEFDETLKMIAVAGLPKGRRLAVLTNSGATRTLLADLGDEAGMIFPHPSPPIEEDLRQQIPEFATVSNPLDYNAAYAGTEGLTMENEPALRQCFATMIRDDYDVVLLSEGALTQTDAQGNAPHYPTLSAWIEAATERGVPAVVVSTMPEQFGPGYRQICIEQGVAPLQGLEDGMTAIKTAVWLAEQPARILTDEYLATLPLPPVPAIPEQGALRDEAKSKALLADFGLNIPRSVVATKLEVQQAIEELTFPLVVKAVGPGLVHKFYVGGVRLGIRSMDELMAAIRTIDYDIAQHALRAEKYLLEEMIADPLVELIIGVTYNPRFGHALLIGPGGVRVERETRASVILLPASKPALEKHVTDLITYLALPTQSLGPIMEAVTAVVTFVEAHRDRLLELDVNPLIVCDGGNKAIAVDAMVRFGESTPHPNPLPQEREPGLPPFGGD